MRGRRTSPLPRSKAAVYLRKSTNFLRAAEAALGDRNFDAAGLDGVHAVISACDSFTVAKLGLRSTAQDHSEAIKLLEEAKIATSTLTQVLETLSLKNKAEYEARQLDETEAVSIVTWAKRVVAYVSQSVRA